ncbi:hypothetical protein ACP2ZN_004402, partial [Shigella flexneri]
HSNPVFQAQLQKAKDEFANNQKK